MKIAFIIPSLNIGYGGSEKVLVRLSNHFVNFHQNNNLSEMNYAVYMLFLNLTHINNYVNQRTSY